MELEKLLSLKISDFPEGHKSIAEHIIKIDLNKLISLNYYEILSVDEMCNSDDIKSAYKKQSMKFHPDKYQFLERDFLNVKDIASEFFLEIQAAFETLSDENKRRKYDLMLAVKKQYQPVDIESGLSEILKHIESNKPRVDVAAFE